MRKVFSRCGLFNSFGENEKKLGVFLLAHIAAKDSRPLLALASKKHFVEGEMGCCDYQWRSHV